MFPRIFVEGHGSAPVYQIGAAVPFARGMRSSPESVPEALALRNKKGATVGALRRLFF